MSEQSDGFPTDDAFDALGQAVGNVRSDMEAIIEKADGLPAPDSLRL
jgi:hypothetical protein